jgi:Domain of unknown function DUF29
MRKNHGNTSDLYEEDFFRWTEQQSTALREAARSGVNLPLDWENLAEEIESLGRSDRRELQSRLGVILEHLLKLEYSPAIDPRRGWVDTIGRERSEIELLLRQSPTLQGEVPGMIIEETQRAVRRVSRTFLRYGEATSEVIGKLTASTYTEDQVLRDWLPEDPLPAPPT